MRPYQRRLIGVLAISVILAAAAVAGHAGWNSHRMRMLEHDLKAATANCDRLVIDFNTWPAPHDKPAIPLVEVSDPAKVHDFLNAIEYKNAEAAMAHACYGDARISLFQGQNKLAVLSYDHSTELNWCHEPAHLTLTSASIDKLNHWRPIEVGPRFGELLTQAQRERFETLRNPKATTQPVAAVSNRSG